MTSYNDSPLSGTHRYRDINKADFYKKLTAAANVLLYIWLTVSFLELPVYDFNVIRRWISQTIVALPMIFLAFSTYGYARFFIDKLFSNDHFPKTGIYLQILTYFYMIIFGSLAIFSVLKIAFHSAVS
ncbi:MAG: hypothetical protein ABF760_05410 [Zymomonas mobilis]|uniref:Succinate dehydrogenase subunit D n=1 Tax=Zymomonas mobilis TaxID=542 RepID=A0A542W0D4_ZYMMB|nr:hypothetical protein [Zymomonas mobilis]TQL17042.1 succinate dehydrogenase subunit D [Zymomonas mobilis]